MNKTACLPWPLPDDFDEERLEGLLFPAEAKPAEGGRPFPDWANIHWGFRKKAVNQMPLREEYKSAYPEGYQ